MPLPVPLRDVVDELQVVSDEITAYINRKTGELTSISHEEALIVEDDHPTDDLPAWQCERLQEVRAVLGSEDFIALPSSFEIHEWSIIERFALGRQDPVQRDDLLRAIHGRGAFRRFKQVVDDLGLREEWFRFRDRTFEEIAVGFLEANGIPYTQGRGGEQEAKDGGSSSL